MLLKIQEPKTPVKPVALGIDLGTTHSLIAVNIGHDVQVFQNQSCPLLPSVVYYPKSEKPLVGKEALAFLDSEPKNTIRSAKRFMGKSINDINPASYAQTITQKGIQIAYETQQGLKTPIEVSAEVLKALYKRAADQISAPIEGVVITVPAYFDEAQRMATKQAAQLAGLNVLRLLHEPTSAAIAYGLEKKTSGTCLVFDLGGGTFDVTLLNIKDHLFQVLATGGHSSLGGDDIDDLVIEKLLGDHNPHAKWAAKTLKERLTDDETAVFKFEDKLVEVKRDEFNEWIKPLVERLLSMTENVLRDAKFEGTLSDIILVGGATKIPYIREAVEKRFQKKVLCKLDPEQVVVRGAALHAAALIGQSEHQKSLLLDVIPLSLGLETFGGVVEKIVARNTPMPAVVKEMFTTYENNQTGMTFHIVQGERELAKDNRSLARFILKDLPPMPKGAAKVEVTYTVNEEGLLTVTAKELSTQQEASIEVNPSFGLSDDAITEILKEAIQHADEDIALKKLTKKRLEGQAMVKSIEQALLEDAHSLQSIQQAVSDLKNALEGTSVEQIDVKIKELEKQSETFMKQRLDRTIKDMVRGKTLDEVRNLCQK